MQIPASATADCSVPTKLRYVADVAAIQELLLEHGANLSDDSGRWPSFRTEKGLSTGCVQGWLHLGLRLPRSSDAAGRVGIEVLHMLVRIPRPRC